ncbi:hypoxanthine phosphoribosyltransferase [Aggregatilinea lenta]|uniref:hypoxanthine phosphoribosyltransferase n=1 Tax=Aggregatilinea lenta TaxID=913108 RepID=UPI000E5C4E56|nr:hypoxanthine phosphoribosyltransferase [Aggregatilinea lenta]
MTAPYERYLQETLISEDALQARIRELGEQITRDYADSHNLLLICILKGGVLFLADLMRHIDVPHAIDFMAISSYGDGVRESSGHVRIDMDLNQDVAGKDLLIVEDIIDSGNTMQYILSLLRTRKPASVRICTLLNKPDRRKVDITLDYVGFDIPDKFVFGYGLDLDEIFRNLPFIGVCRPDMDTSQS